MLKKYYTSNNFLLIGCCLIAIGIPCDGFLRATENIGLISVFISSAINFRKSSKKGVFHPVNILFSSMFLLCVFGYFYSVETAELHRKTGLKVLLILFPLAFAFTPKLTDTIKRVSIIFFTTITALLAFLSVIEYFLHYTEYNLMIAQSKPIPIVGGTMHIYFSVILAIAIFLGLHLLNRNFKIVLTTRWDKIILMAFVINFIALHILSARTGLFAFYVALVFILIRYSWQHKRFKVLIGGLALIIAFPTIMYMAVPSVKNRINNTYDDIHRYFTGDYVGYYSISGRFETWKAAIHIFEKHKLFGVGAGDLSSAIETQFKIDNTRLMREESLPNCHNQYIETLATHGILGIVVFLALILAILKLVKSLPKNNYLMLSFIIVFITAFIVESLLERQAGLTLFLFTFYLIKNNALSEESQFE